MSCGPVGEEQPRIFLDQLCAQVSDTSDGELRIAELGECRHRGDVETGAVQANDPVRLVDARKPLDRLDRLGWLGVVVIFDQLDLARTALELETARLVHLVSPQLPRREKSRGRAGRKRTGFRAHDADFHRAGIGVDSPDKWSGQRRRAGIFQQFASSHRNLPDGFLPMPYSVAGEGGMSSELRTIRPRWTVLSI